MENMILTITISFVNLIKQNDSSKYIQYLIRLSEQLSKKYQVDKPQLFSLPIAENQPPAVPFALASNNKFSISLSMNGATFQFRYDTIMKAEQIVNNINDIICILFNNKKYDICNNKFRTVQLRITTNRIMNDYDELLSYANKLQNYYYRFGVGKTGFTFACSQIDDKLPFTSEMVSYSTSCNIENGQLGISINKDYILGGIDCSKVKFIALNNHDINNFIDYVGKVDMSKHIKETYGLSAE